VSGRPKIWGLSQVRGVETNDVEDGDVMLGVVSGTVRMAVREDGAWVQDAFARKQDTWRAIIKTSDTTLDDTPAADPDLQFTASANGRFVFRARLYFDMEEGLRWGIVGPAGSWRWRRSWVRYADTSEQGVALEQAPSDEENEIVIADGDGGVIDVDGVVLVGGTGGLWAVAWAASAGTEAVMRAGSYVEYRQIKG
jgi:hypothetical protein